MNRGHHVTNKVSYSYQLCSLTSDPTMLGAGFQLMSTAFHHTRVEDYNWNYLDQHICGHSDFEELGEVRKEKMNTDVKYTPVVEQGRIGNVSCCTFIFMYTCVSLFVYRYIYIYMYVYVYIICSHVISHRWCYTDWCACVCV